MRFGGLWLVGIPLLLLTPNSFGFTERRNWVFEQLGGVPYPSNKDEPRYQGALSIVNYSDSLSTQGSILLDARYFELRVGASQRSFLVSTDKGAFVRDLLSPESQTIYAELARNYVTRENHFGRIGVEYLQFFPSSAIWMKFGIDTGIMESPGLPWSLQLHASLFTNNFKESKILYLSTETARAFEAGLLSRIRLGTIFSWTYRIRDTSVAFVTPGAFTFEYMLFSFGPFFELNSGVGKIRLGLQWRLWLDKEITLIDPNTNQLGFPSEIATIPDVALTWTLGL